ncbi:hypothetical protein [Rhodanobacter lindaniclasticus]
MNEHGLTSDALRQQHADSVAKGDTFEPKGLSRREALDYLKTDEGAMYWWRVAEADPGAPSNQIDDRAINQLRSGRKLPRMETIQPGEALLKLVPENTSPTTYSSYWARESQVNAAIAAGRNLSEYFGLPIGSEAPRFDAYQITPRFQTQVFISTVAPTSELGGLVTKGGGAEQVLVPNRKLFHDPVYVKSVANIPDIAIGVERSALTSTLVRGVGVLSVAAAVGDAYTTAEQYQALSAHNSFGADALLRHYEGRTAGGLLGGFGAGAAYGAAFGAETGPGAFVTGALGGVIGAFAGDRIATMVTEHKVNHQTGSDGVDYVYAQGQWTHTHYRIDADGPVVPNPYGIGAMTSAVTRAPTEQVAQLDYQRMTAITALALANPAEQDTRHITLDGTSWQATDEGWTRQVASPDVRSNALGVPVFVDTYQPADDRTRERLDQIAANRQYNNDHYAGDVAKAYVMDYLGNGWAANGPLPEAVTDALHRPSEAHVRDPLTGQRWTVDAAQRFSREERHVVDRVVIRNTVHAHGDELARLEQQRQAAVAGNATYGRQLIADAFEQAAGRETSHAKPGHAASIDSPAHTQPVTPNSSNRELFDALVSAAQRLDLAGMREVGQAYLQSHTAKPGWPRATNSTSNWLSSNRPPARSARQRRPCKDRRDDHKDGTLNPTRDDSHADDIRALALQLAAFTAALEQRGDQVVQQTRDAARHINEMAASAVATSERLTASALDQFRQAAAAVVTDGMRHPLEDAGRTMQVGTHAIESATGELAARVRTVGKTLTTLAWKTFVASAIASLAVIGVALYLGWRTQQDLARAEWVGMINAAIANGKLAPCAGEGLCVRSGNTWVRIDR